jgi:hypothetical protein
MKTYLKVIGKQSNFLKIDYPNATINTCDPNAAVMLKSYKFDKVCNDYVGVFGLQLCRTTF